MCRHAFGCHLPVGTFSSRIPSSVSVSILFNSLPLQGYALVLELVRRSVQSASSFSPGFQTLLLCLQQPLCVVSHFNTILQVRDMQNAAHMPSGWYKQNVADSVTNSLDKRYNVRRYDLAC